MPALRIRRPKRLRRRPSILHVSEILAWADAFHRKHGRWPRQVDGPVDEAPDTTWCGIAQALRKGGRGLPTRSGWSLAQLLAVRRGVRNKKHLPDLTIKQILMWADAHCRRTGTWPNWKSGPIKDAPGESWMCVNAALRNGGRGMVGGSSLGLLLAARRRLRTKNASAGVRPANALWRNSCYNGYGVRNGLGGASWLPLPRRSYSEMTWAPSRSTVAAISRLNSTTIAVVSDP